MMRREQLRTLILINDKGESRSFRFHNAWKEETKDQFILELSSEQEIHQFTVTNMDEEITDLIDNKGEVHRILSLSYHVPTETVDEEEFKFHIAESFHNALNLVTYINVNVCACNN